MKNKFIKILKKIKSLIRVFNFLAKHPLFSFIFLFLVSLLLGGVIFYKYIFLAQRAEYDPPKDSYSFKEDIYKNVLKILQDQERKFSENDKKEYINIFLEPQISAGEAKQLPNR